MAAQLQDPDGRGTKQRPRGWWYPWLFVAFFAVVVSVNGVMIYFATSTFSGLETEDHYVKGLNYNDAIDATRRQQALGWTGELTFSSTGASAGMLAFTVTDAEGRPLDGLAVHAIVLRPTSEGTDREVVLAGLGGGRYGAALELPLAGQWRINLYARRGEDMYHLSRRIHAP